jgi:hypothetical protein
METSEVIARRTGVQTPEEAKETMAKRAADRFLRGKRLTAKNREALAAGTGFSPAQILRFLKHRHLFQRFFSGGVDPLATIAKCVFIDSQMVGKDPVSNRTP